jgi:hypothetical protein
VLLKAVQLLVCRLVHFVFKVKVKLVAELLWLLRSQNDVARLEHQVPSRLEICVVGYQHLNPFQSTSHLKLRLPQHL